MECSVGFAETVIISFNEVMVSEVRNNLVEIGRIFNIEVVVNQVHTKLTPLVVGTSNDIVKRPSIGVFEKLPATPFATSIVTQRNEVESPHI